MRTFSKWIMAGTLGLGCVVSSGIASAQEKAEMRSYFNEAVRAPRNAFELSVGSSYTQGLAQPATGYSFNDLTQEGIVFGLQAGYRLSPEFSLNLWGEYNEFVSGHQLTAQAGTRGFVAGVSATYHFMPRNRIDPWVLAGVGYRQLWLVGDTPATDAVWHGIEWGRINAGVDLRATEDIAFGPVIGVDLTEFIVRNPKGDAGPEEISNKRVNPYLFAGIQARFDLFGARESYATGVATAK
jgi:hypothetical protein